MEDWLKCQISPLVKYRQNKTYNCSTWHLYVPYLYHIKLRNPVLFHAHWQWYSVLLHQHLQAPVVSLLYKLRVISLVSLYRHLLHNEMNTHHFFPHLIVPFSHLIVPFSQVWLKIPHCIKNLLFPFWNQEILNSCLDTIVELWLKYERYHLSTHIREWSS